MRYCTLEPATPLVRGASTAIPAVLRLHGRWVLRDLAEIQRDLRRALGPVSRPAAADDLLSIDGTRLEALDTAAANLLLQFLARRRRRRKAPDPAPAAKWLDTAAGQLVGFDEKHRRLLELIQSRHGGGPATPATEPARGLLWRLGRAGYAQERYLLDLLQFFGLLAVRVLSLVRSPRTLRWRETLLQCRHCGLEAIPVVLLITFLIGVVVAYLLGLQASRYGANIFVIDGVALGMVREFSPLLVATIVAGRSGAAFTAQLGTMKLTEEIDAIRMTGLSAEQVLIVPRVLALVLTLPLLVFVGDVAGLAGAAAVCHWMLDLSPATFVDRIQSELGITHFVIGLVKAPVFALAVAVIGCHSGMTVARDTRAIGAATTATVVQSIVAVILLDAVFAVVLQLIGL